MFSPRKVYISAVKFFITYEKIISFDTKISGVSKFERKKKKKEEKKMEISDQACLGCMTHILLCTYILGCQPKKLYLCLEGQVFCPAGAIPLCILVMVFIVSIITDVIVTRLTLCVLLNYRY